MDRIFQGNTYSTPDKLRELPSTIQPRIKRIKQQRRGSGSRCQDEAPPDLVGAGERPELEPEDRRRREGSAAGGRRIVLR